MCNIMIKNNIAFFENKFSFFKYYKSSLSNDLKKNSIYIIIIR